MRFSLILPIYNECENLRKNFPAIYKELKKIGDSEVIIAEDGSKDCTKEYARKFAKLPNVIFLSSPKRLGRGGALKHAISVAQGRVIGYMDIDLAVPLPYLAKAVEMVEAGNPVVVGSRYSKGSKASRSPKRLIESVVFNILMRVLLGSKIRDHQCGFKFWDSSFIKKEYKNIMDNHWFFDSEMLVIAQRKHLKIYEMPVEWKEQENTKVRSSDLVYFVRSMLDMRARLKAGNAIKSRKTETE
ncbi:MAG: glycosyltransferase [Candidatus Micrarchaeia archaeon]